MASSLSVRILPRVPQQTFAGGAQIDIRLGPAEQLGAETIFQALDLHAHGRLGPVQHDGRTGEGAVVRHRDERPQQIRIKVGRVHHETLFLPSSKFHSLI